MSSQLVNVSDLRVIDLKNELERRHLDKSGVKAVLVERLKNALAEAGEGSERIELVVNEDVRRVSRLGVGSRSPSLTPSMSQTSIGNDALPHEAVEGDESSQMSLPDIIEVSDAVLVEHPSTTSEELMPEAAVPMSEFVDNEHLFPDGDAEIAGDVDPAEEAEQACVDGESGEAAGADEDEEFDDEVPTVAEGEYDDYGEEFDDGDEDGDDCLPEVMDDAEEGYDGDAPSADLDGLEDADEMGYEESDNQGDVENLDELEDDGVDDSEQVDEEASDEAQAQTGDAGTADEEEEEGDDDDDVVDDAPGTPTLDEGTAPSASSSLLAATVATSYLLNDDDLDRQVLDYDVEGISLHAEDDDQEKANAMGTGTSGAPLAESAETADSTAAGTTSAGGIAQKKEPSTSSSSSASSAVGKTSAAALAASKAKELALKSIWISGLSSNTRAAELKAKCTMYGTVLSSKIVTNPRSGGKIYGYVSMSSIAEANRCISAMHRTKFQHRFITVEKAKGDPSLAKRPGAAAKKTPVKPSVANTNKDNTGAKGAASSATKASPPQSSGSRMGSASSDHGRVITVDQRGGPVTISIKTADTKSRGRGGSQADKRRSGGVKVTAGQTGRTVTADDKGKTRGRPARREGDRRQPGQQNRPMARPGPRTGPRPGDRPGARVSPRQVERPGPRAGPRPGDRPLRGGDRAGPRSADRGRGQADPEQERHQRLEREREAERRLREDRARERQERERQETLARQREQRRMEAERMRREREEFERLRKHAEERAAEERRQREGERERREKERRLAAEREQRSAAARQQRAPERQQRPSAERQQRPPAERQRPPAERQQRPPPERQQRTPTARPRRSSPPPARQEPPHGPSSSPPPSSRSQKPSHSAAQDDQPSEDGLATLLSTLGSAGKTALANIKSNPDLKNVAALLGVLSAAQQQQGPGKDSKPAAKEFEREDRGRAPGRSEPPLARKEEPRSARREQPPRPVRRENRDQPQRENREALPPPQRREEVRRSPREPVRRGDREPPVRRDEPEPPMRRDMREPVRREEREREPIRRDDREPVQHQASRATPAHYASYPGAAGNGAESVGAPRREEPTYHAAAPRSRMPDEPARQLAAPSDMPSRDYGYDQARFEALTTPAASDWSRDGSWARSARDADPVRDAARDAYASAGAGTRMEVAYKKPADDWPAYRSTSSAGDASHMPQMAPAGNSPPRYHSADSRPPASYSSYERATATSADLAGPRPDSHSYAAYGDRRGSGPGGPVGAATSYGSRSSQSHDYGHGRQQSSDVGQYSAAATAAAAAAVASGTSASGSILSAAELAELAHIVQLQQHRSPAGGRSSQPASSAPQYARDATNARRSDPGQGYSSGPATQHGYSYRPY